MGLGGHVLWTSVIRRLHEESGQSVRVSYAPAPSDLLSGRLYCGDVSLADDPIFVGNPRIQCPPVIAKSRAAKAFDRVTLALIRRTGLVAGYESAVLALTRLRRRRTGQYDAQIDLHRHSYVERELPDRMIWKRGGHIVDIILANYGLSTREHAGEIYFSAADMEDIDALRRQRGLGGSVAVIEPNSKEDWFGDLRAWPFDRWQQVVDRLLHEHRYQVVQVGTAGSRALSGVINLSGALSLRQTMALIKRSQLFLGLEGGLMHAARAVGTEAVIVWGGLTLPEFAAYPERHRVLCTYVECSPCGLRGGCPYDKKCLTSISVDEVVAAIAETTPDAFAASRP